MDCSTAKPLNRIGQFALEQNMAKPSRACIGKSILNQYDELKGKTDKVHSAPGNDPKGVVAGKVACEYHVNVQ